MYRLLKKLLGRYGIKIIGAVEEFDESPEGEFFELLSMGMAELYSKKLARESFAGQLANARLGKVLGGTPLLGYKIKGKYYVIEEQEAEAVKIIFNMAARGEGYRTIQRYLNDNGYRRADYPILATVIEVRNHVAHLDEWEKRVFEFSKLTVRLES